MATSWNKLATACTNYCLGRLAKRTLWVLAALALPILSGCSHHPPRAEAIMAALRANPPPPGGPYFQEVGAKHLVDPQIIREDFLKVRIGMSRKAVLSLLGKPWRSRREPKPARFWTYYLGGDPPAKTATFIQADWYYPAPPLKRQIDSPYSAWGFELFYDTNDRVVFKRIHPDVVD